MKVAIFILLRRATAAPRTSYKLNTPFYIAQRLMTRESTEKGLSRPIVRIAAAGIALGMAVMILAVAIVTGFQHEIREKVIGFGSHIQITNFASGSERYNDPRLEVAQPFYPHLDTLPEVKSISLYALKQGIIETPENIQGVFVKGVSSDYDWSFIQAHLVEGDLLSLSDTGTHMGVLMSAYLAGRMGLALGDAVTVYFPNARQGMSQRRLRLRGIFDTGLRELDARFLFADLQIIRKVNQWGLDAQLVAGSCEGGYIELEARGFGGDGEHRFLWSVDSLRGPGPYRFNLATHPSVSVVLRDRSQTIADTAYFVLTRAVARGECPEEDGYRITTSGGSGKYYTGGFDVRLRRYKDLDRMDQFIYENLNYNLRTTSIVQRSPEIFNWLEMLDINTAIIIALMVLIAVINMTSALLILITERTQMIGILKALGATTWLVQRIFLVQSAWIIATGMLLGNALGLGLGYIQQRYGVVKLDPENYYVSEVPILFEWEHLLWLNAGTLLTCLLFMLLPSLTVRSITPIKAIRFD